MRTVYKNPKELATFLKDSIDSYLENLITYEKLEERVKKIIDSNGERVYKNGIISPQLAKVLGDSRIEIMDKIAK
ncbi:MULTISPECIES: TIGR04540 family protein [Clostridium]|jgi:uncharacterized protein (TIGR04540 family)|uniref:Uncharacterized protein n=3 Tax=Clostridium intestinale TaxID=36845 RepID=U2PXW8_9CLOT|nr:MULTISPECIES: TIGR04540 family protein [Clostridium]ERK31320.1 hypothetical protein CINTURNW_2401 [Clostridium intestinale URNW]QLY81677.1 TIGR04540 family protein [Clostridium intestinale]WRY52358.1 TIGR04540 family protein [Clostridium intestinale]SHH78308.1 conserved hypothetical protein [Clostridium intestinale DSM 6191]